MEVLVKYMEVHGSISEVHGSTWKYMEVHGSISEVHGSTWK